MTSSSPSPNPAAALAATDDATVRAALESALVFDGHNDLAWESRAEADYSTDGLGTYAPHGRFQTDVARLRRGGVGAQFWSVYVPTSMKGADAVTATLEQIDFVHRFVSAYPDDLALARTGADVRAAWAGGKVASLLGAEGGHSIDDSLAVLRMLSRLGVAYMTLTHNDNTAWADSATDKPVHGGLTDVGRDVVREMNQLGMLVDLSHVSAATMHDALDVTDSPVIFSHSSCRAVADHPRNVPDDVLVRVRDNGGVLMVAFVPMFLSEAWAAWRDGGKVGPEPTVSIDDVVVHIEHAREVMGVEHVGFGGDYDGFAPFPPGLEDVTSYPRILEALAERGWTADELAALAGGNALRVLDAVSGGR